jgi:hypothetical protein
MSGGRPAVDKNRPIVEDATRAGEPDSAGRLPLRRVVNPAAIGVSLAETAETPRGLAAVANVSAARPDWRNACGNCGNSFASSKRRPTFRPLGFRRELQ